MNTNTLGSHSISLGGVDPPVSHVAITEKAVFQRIKPNMYFVTFVSIALPICISSALLLSPPLVLAQNVFNGSIILHDNASTISVGISKIVCYPLRYGSSLDHDSCI